MWSDILVYDWGRSPIGGFCLDDYENLGAIQIEHLWITINCSMMELCSTLGIILPVIFHESKNLPGTLREERELLVMKRGHWQEYLDPKVNKYQHCWEKLFNDELHNLSSNVIRMIKNGDQMAWKCGIDKKFENCIKNLVGNLRDRDFLEELGIDGRIILERILRKYLLRLWTAFVWLKVMSSGECFSTFC
jgi:hypothetical protein